MPDRDKVITHLLIIHTWADFFGESGRGIDPVFCRDIVKWVGDAIALLKEQEPRVMTLEEAKSASGYVFVESCSCNILEIQLIKDGFVYDSFTKPGAVDDIWWEGYNKHWRLWTSVPTDEQMEATPWQE